MPKRKVYDDENHVHFVTFSCFKRRNYLQSDQAKRILIGCLGSRLTKHDGLCIGFVIMPNHVHAMIWFTQPSQLSPFMDEWKGQTSKSLKELFITKFPSYWSKVDDSDPIWQPRFYDFNIWSRSKVEQKLDYMHMNPVRAELVEKATEWRWSSARWYINGKTVGLPIRWPPGLETDDQFDTGR